MKAALLPLAIALTLAGCADPEPAQKRAPGGVQAGERLDAAEPSPTARAVNIGEGGTRFAACQGRGRVGNLRGGKLAVRDAPFDDAKQIGELTENAHVFICTRSLDQQWLGVVVASEDGTKPVPAAPTTAPATQAEATPSAPGVDCGVTAPVRGKRAYAGPCQSGWVESTFVAMVAR
ncbi:MULTISPECIES: hypothetical protein [Pseudomonadota]|jgi:hypothetical protein|uniref:hypothetical protein n=2 Tax=Pseudomonadota TaxID=1224 RepID=UPI00076A8825|nr:MULTISPECIES: hypothetical protein [Pseudomonadota]MAF62502.1 hypothetical protein [Blastomonas sp.]|tara:strand:+ start:175225 stop:175755 length:531 start_codon:yes stop_codon:yes gene_type:complete